ncbi:MAG: hypothetical protein LC117_08815 [Bacteroidia bacterium]|nr:hypothetical protein [Bacteroidia bacterium]MCZ2278014.1 hypothetical protein [Bacteroidia bacterium]
MISTYRTLFNKSFTEAKYLNMLNEMNAKYNYRIPFRIAESPVFVPAWFKKQMTSACENIIDFINQNHFKQLTQASIPTQLNMPGEGSHSIFLAFDFAVARDDSGQLVPRLIELQGFPSLFGWQHYLATCYRKFFNIDSKLNHLFTDSVEAYFEMVREAITGNREPEHTILLEIDPDNQNTRIDFLLTEKFWGVKSICISKVKSSGKELYYEYGGKRIPIHRIYNRVIFDELGNRPDIIPGFDLMREYDVEWAGHPNWFFRISKFIMPELMDKSIPETYFLDRIKTIPDDLENYVLKPLFSFSGSGVIFHLTREILNSIPNPSEYILQRKVVYEPVIKSPDEPVKAELRLLYLWNDVHLRPQLAINMARLSKGEMIGVKHNKNKTWVGGSVGFYE